MDWSPEREQIALKVLKDMESDTHARRLPPAVFEALCALHKRISTELIAFSPEGTDVWMVQRPTLEQNPSERFPGAWHVPGVVHSPAETDRKAFDRLMATDFGTSTMSRLVEWQGMSFPLDERGSTYHSVIYFAVMHKVPEVSSGAFLNIAMLRNNNILKCHREVLFPPALLAAREMGYCR